jgi:DNA modification methylase
VAEHGRLYGAVGGNTYAGFNERWSGTGGAGSKQDATLAGVTDRKINTGLKPKNLLGIPWRVRLALQADGWILRQDIIWHKPNPMPESVRDRCTKAHEYIFLMSKSDRYFFDSEAMREPAVKGPQRMQADPETARRRSVGPMARGEEGFNHQYADPDRVWAADGKRNRRSVWTVATQPYDGAHFATYPPALIEPCILAGSRPGDTVLDPFMGSGTTAQVAQDLGRKAIGCELNPDYVALQSERAAQLGLEL